jgi:hypothetical protein
MVDAGTGVNARWPSDVLSGRRVEPNRNALGLRQLVEPLRGLGMAHTREPRNAGLSAARERELLSALGTGRVDGARPSGDKH